MNSLYINIRNRRLELGMSQEELAIKMGYTSRSTIAKIEAGKNDIPQSKIQAFAKALDTTPGALMGWEKTPHQNSAEIVLSNHEKDLVIAYREKPSMQSAVDTLLGIPSDDADNSTENIYPIKKAAHNNSQKATIADSKDNLVEIPYVARSGERGTVTKTQEELDSILPLLETLEAKSDPDL